MAANFAVTKAIVILSIFAMGNSLTLGKHIETLYMLMEVLGKQIEKLGKLMKVLGKQMNW